MHALSHGIAKFEFLDGMSEIMILMISYVGLFCTWSYCSICITLIYDMNLNLPCGDVRATAKIDARGARAIINFKNVRFVIITNKIVIWCANLLSCWSI